MGKERSIVAMCLGGALIAALAIGGTEVEAQSRVYRCSTTEGRAYLSDRPCDGSTPAVLGTIGPTRDSRSTASTYSRATPKAVDYLEFMSPQCAELAEGLRNGPARGLGSTAMGELQTHYRAKCAEDEHRARLRWNEEQKRVHDTRLADERGAKAERDRQALSREQCDEMYRILHRRRETLPSMTSGERADFHRFEANWKARCHAP